MANITVYWKMQKGSIAGQIVRDVEGKDRSKIVFIDRNYYGRNPQPGEETEAEVVRDTKSEDPGTGALIVRPVFTAELGALTLEQLKQKLFEMVLTLGIVLGDSYFEVKFPGGWRGVFKSIRPRIFEPGIHPLIRWRYDDEAGTMCYISAPDRQDGFVITTGITTGGCRGSSVTNWKKACADLGSPKSVEPRMISGCKEGDPLIETGRADVIWEDKYGHQLRAVIEASQLWSTAIYRNIRQSECSGVVADIHLLDGRWIMRNQTLATGEAFSEHHGRVLIARLESQLCFSDDVRQEVTRVIRPWLHTVEWHRQNYLHAFLAETASWKEAIWMRIREAEQGFADPICPWSMITSLMGQVENARAHAGEMLSRTLFCEECDGNSLYQNGIPDDTADTERLMAENRETLKRLDKKIVELQASAEAAQRRVALQDTAVAAWEILEDLDSRYQAFVQTNHRLVRSTQCLFEDRLKRALATIALPGQIEAKVARVYELRAEMIARFEKAEKENW